MNMNDYKKVTDRLEPDERCRKEVLDMSKRENRIKQNTNEFEEKVSGVEVRRGNGALRFVGIAAAFALIAGGIGTTGVLLHKNSRNVSQLTEAGEEETVTEEITEEVTEEPTESEAGEDYDYEAIAREITDGYLERTDILVYGDVEYDANDTITFYTYDSSDAEWSENYGGERTFYKVTDERFNSCQDIYDYYKELIANTIEFGGHSEPLITASDYKDGVTLDGAGVVSYLGGDASRFENGSKVDLYIPDPEDDSTVDYTAHGINGGVYIDYNGSLYVTPRAAQHGWDEHYTSEPVIVENSEDKIVVSRYINNNIRNEQYGIQKLFTLVLQNGEWKIQSIGTGMQPEYLSSIAIQCYLEDRAEYNDINIDCGDIMAPLEMLEYDEENKTSRVHAVLHDVNGVDAIDVTADIDLNSVKVTSADITRLNEYDGTLKRPSVIWAEEHPDGKE